MGKKARLFKSRLRKGNRIAKQFYRDNEDEFTKAFYNLVCYGFECTELKEDGSIRNIDYPEFEELIRSGKLKKVG